jgi:hypothetical protein
MWHVDAIHNTLIVTGNGDTKPTHAAMTLFYNGGKDSYTIEKPLQPGDQIWADVGQIIRNQVPDKNGVRCSSGLRSGWVMMGTRPRTSRSSNSSLIDGGMEKSLNSTSR